MPNPEQNKKTLMSAEDFRVDGGFIPVEKTEQNKVHEEIEQIFSLMERGIGYIFIEKLRELINKHYALPR